MRLKFLGDAFRDLAFNREDVGQLAIVNVSPEMAIGRRLDQLDVDAHLVRRTLHATFEDVRDAQLPRDFRQVIRRTLEVLR